MRRGLRLTGRRRALGFSLLELLIALAFLSFIAVGLANALGLSIQIFSRTSAQQALSGPIAHRVRLRGWLTAAASPAVSGALSARLVGTTTELAFSTTSATAFAPEAFGMHVRVYVEDSALYLDATPFDRSGAPLERQQALLARAVSGLAISYYDARRETWLQSWTDDQRIPSLVRIEMAPGSSPDWPGFTVRLARGS